MVAKKYYKHAPIEHCLADASHSRSTSLSQQNEFTDQCSQYKGYMRAGQVKKKQQLQGRVLSKCMRGICLLQASFYPAELRATATKFYYNLSITISFMKGQANKNQPQQQPPQKKPAAPVKEAPKEWKAEDYVGPHSPIETVRDVKAAFDIFDTDNSGLVDAGELRQAFISLGLATANKLVYNIMHKLDGEHPNGLNFAEFLKLATGRLGETHTRKQIDKVFHSFDNEGNGKINAQEFKHVAVELGEHLSDDEIEKIFSKTDLDGDGYVTAEDFYAIMTHKPYWQ